jgi:Asp-tRNA(Asn)/Glu-tRNA(Gln) amidotransferase A subunit family amidase
MPISDYATTAEPATALADRKVSSFELTEAQIARIDGLDGPINAVYVKTYGRARAAAKAANERLASDLRCID